ncbi:hypothetical protein ACF0H5_005835 [Mactra antiquata]
MEDDTHSHVLDGSQQNLNDLQSYLVNFNKEIGVHGEVSAFSVSQIISQASQPVYVTVPVSSETTTPDEEQLPVISGMKDKTTTDIHGIVTSVDNDVDGGHPEPTIYTDIDVKPSPLGTVVVDSQIDGLDTSKIQFQELNIDQLGLQTGIAVSDGMVMLPMGDASNIISPSSDHKLAQVQILTINGQPTLQLVGDPSLLHQQLNTGVTESHTFPAVVQTSQVQTLIDGTSPVAVLSANDTTNNVTVLASVAANTNAVNQTQHSHVQNIQIPSTETQLVALQDTGDNTQPQMLTLSYNDLTTGTITAGATDKTFNTDLNTASMIKKEPGYQSVAILSNEDGNQDGEVNYVLIVNPNGDKTNVQGPSFDLRDNLNGEIYEELAGDSGVTQHFVKINQLLTSGNQIHTSQGTAEDPLSCSHCDYTSTKKYLLSRHMKSHCDDKPHKCGLCNKGFKSVSSLQNHLNTHTGVRPHKCRVCESAFTTSGELIRHIRYKHTFEKPHKCTECDYASVELSKLKRHMRSHTGERPYACCYCNYASPDTYKLKRHLRIHTGEKPYECDVCHAKFTQSNSLKAHKLIHSGNKPVFKCSLCPATCGRKTDLKIHMQKLHSTDQTLVCKKCGETFSDRYTLKVHFKSHEGEKCFKCVECDYSATSQRHVDTHMLVHSGLKPFECDECDLAFRQKKLLKQHRNIFHNPNCRPEHLDENAEGWCKACFFIYKKNNEQSVEQINIKDDEINGKDTHTCGGCQKSLVDTITPLTADQLIENGLLADMKDGKLGTSPKVVVVHPDGRVEEVTAKLQSLSQTKPMDDFLVSLGVSGESHFDQVTSLPNDVCVTEVQTFVDGKDSLPFVKDIKSENIGDTSNEMECQPVLETTTFNVTNISPELEMACSDSTKEESTQASFDSDDDSKKVKILTQEQFLQLAQNAGTHSPDLQDCFEETSYKIVQGDQTVIGNMPQIVVSMLPHDDTHSSLKRSCDTMDDHVTKSFRTDTALTDE